MSKFQRLINAMEAAEGAIDISGSPLPASNEFNQPIYGEDGNPRAYGKILSGTNPYAWEEVAEDETGAWYATGVRSGTVDVWPAREVNDIDNVEADTIVELQFQLNGDGLGEWVFTAPAGSFPTTGNIYEWTWVSIDNTYSGGTWYESSVGEAIEGDCTSGDVWIKLPATRANNNTVMFCMNPDVTFPTPTNKIFFMTQGGDLINGKVSTGEFILCSQFPNGGSWVFTFNAATSTWWSNPGFNIS
jgi:hypothetical protein